MMSARLMTTPSGIPEAMPLALQTMSGWTPVCSTAHHLPVRPAPWRPDVTFVASNAEGDMQWFAAVAWSALTARQRLVLVAGTLD